MNYTYDDEDELDIRVRRGRVSPVPIIYPEHRRPVVSRPAYYPHGSGYLVAEPSGGGLHRSRSTGSRPAPPPAPVIINNRIYNENYDEEVIDDDRYVTSLGPPLRARSRSRSRPNSFAAAQQDFELERTRRELDAYKFEAHRGSEERRIQKERELEAYKREALREKEEKRIKREIELEMLRKEKEEEERKELIKKEKDKAIEKYKIEQAEKKEKETKEKEERDAEYKRRLGEDLRKGGLDERQIAAITNKNKPIDPNRPTYTRMSRRHLSIETLNRFRIDYEFDVDPDYVLIKRWVPEYEQDFLWNHTREIRELRAPVYVAIESGKKKGHHHEPEFEIVRKKHERKASPNKALLTFFAGGKR